MAPADKSTLRQILDGQIELVIKMDNLNTRLFGGDGQKGCIPILFEKHELLSATVQNFKDSALKAVQDTKDVEIGTIRMDIVDIKSNAKLAMWKTSSLSSIIGGGVGIGLSLLVKKILGIH
jgi:hypothetical protein